MKKHLTVLLVMGMLFCFPVKKSSAQDFGASFSYFFPRNGQFSVPVAPLSIRGLGLKFGDNFSLTTGISLYRVSGMGVTGVPFEQRNSIIGPSLPLMMPLQANIIISSGPNVYKFRGGVFGFYNFGTEINHGNLDRALLEHTGWESLNSRVGVESNFGSGYIVGFDYINYIRENIGIKLGGSYLMGGADIKMKGNYTGFPESGDELHYVPVDYPDSRLDFTGLELTIGVVVKQGE